MLVRKLCLAVLLALMAVAGLSAQSRPLPRLRVSENGRFFVRKSTATRECKPPSSGENHNWVLVLDAAAKKLPVPGKR
jgi:hypothetical protein